MNRARGFTLIELMVVIAVVAILMMVAVPNMRAFVQNNRITGTANQIYSSLNLARGEAMKRQQPVLFEALSSGGASNEFGNGWIIYRDMNGNSTYQTTDVLISRVEALPGNTTLDAAPNATQIQFNADGRVTTGETLSMRIPACRGPQGRDIAVSAVGRVSVTTVGC